jgi:hypothetical protein
VAAYYGVIIEEEKEGKERDIRRLAFNVPDTAQAPDRPQEFDFTGNMLVRLLLTAGIQPGSGSLTQYAVKYLLDRGVPVIAGAAHMKNGIYDTAYPKHMYVIMGYRDKGDDIELLVSDPGRAVEIGDTCINVDYSVFTDAERFGDGDVATERWVETMYMINPPLVPPIKNTVVDKVAVKNKTVMSALDVLRRDPSNFGGTTRLIQLWDTVATRYDERIVIDSTVSDVRIMSDPRVSLNPVFKSSHALRVIGARGIEISTIDIESDSAVYNSGELTILPLKISAPTGPAIQNTGKLVIDYATNFPDHIAMVEAKSDHAIYNTGTIIIGAGVISAPSGYAAINNEDINGALTLGGSPVIIGRIAGFGAGKISVYASGSYVFTPGNRKHVIDQANLRNGDIVIVNGAKFIDNFELTNTKLLLTAKGNNLIAASWGQFLVSKLGAMFNTICDALLPAKPGQEIVVMDSESYEEQVTIDSTLSGLSIRPKIEPLFSRPKIRYFPDSRNAPPRNYAELLKRQGDTFTIGVNIEENSALRVFGATGVLIDGIDIEGENAVYNTGAVTLRNGTVTATSDCAIYNTGTIEITNTEVFAASGYAICNDGTGGSLVLGGNPAVTGRIAGFGAGKIGVYTSGEYAFAPGNRKYELSPNNIRSGDVVVTGGANFINNFELADTDFILAARGNNLVAVALYTVSFNPDGGTGETIPDITRVLENSRLSEAQMPRADGFVKAGYVSDGKWYVLSDSGYSEFAFGENGTPVTGNTALCLKWTPVISVSTPERVVPPVNRVSEAVAVVPVGAFADGFTAGPIPVSKRFGAVRFFRQGNDMENGTLRIYDNSGNFVKKIDVGGRGGTQRGSGMRSIGSWNLKDCKGRAVSEGTYFVKGVIKTVGGKQEKVSLVIGVR